MTDKYAKYSVMRMRQHIIALIVLICAMLLSSHPALAQFSQQGPKLVGTGAVGNAVQGNSVSLSADGNTAIVGGPADNSGAGAAWVWTSSGGVWTQQGPKLVGTGAAGGNSQQGQSVALSADGNTAIVGAHNDTGTWVWTRSGGVWTQQGTKLVPSGVGGFGFSGQGNSVSLSADGNTAIVGGPADNSGAGAAWVWTRSGGVWTQQGTKLVGSGTVGNAGQGVAVALSADGNTAIVGGYADNSQVGAAWIWTRSGGVWTQQGTKLVGSGAVGNALQGYSVSLSADGNTAIVGGFADNGVGGGAWVWTRSAGVWTQQGTKLVGSGGPVVMVVQGYSVSLSADGNTAIVGGFTNGSLTAAAWAWTRIGGVWTQQETMLIGSDAVGVPSPDVSVALSADGKTAIVGGGSDQPDGAAWVFAAPISPPTCEPPDPTFVYPDDSAAFGLFAGSQQAALDGGTTNVSYKIDPTDVISSIFHKRAIGLWFSITAIEYDSTIIQLEPDNTDTIGGNSAAAGIISPDGHANYIIRFCKPGEVTFKLEFDKPAIALTLLDQFVPFTPDVRELSQGLLEIPLYDSAVTNYVQAWQSTRYADLLHGLFRTSKDLSALARNRQQMAMIVAVFERFGINITLKKLAKGLSSKLVKVVRDLPKLIIDVWTYDALLAGGKPLELKLVAPATHR